MEIDRERKRERVCEKAWVRQTKKREVRERERERRGKQMNRIFPATVVRFHPL